MRLGITVAILAAAAIAPSCGGDDSPSRAPVNSTPAAPKPTATAQATRSATARATAQATARATPSPTAPASATDPSIFFGRLSTDAAFQEYVLQNGCESNNLARRCRLSGVEITLDTGGRIAGMIFLVVGDDVYRPYTGPLPGGIGVRDTKAAVNKRLGAPTSSGPDWAAYAPQISGTISLFIDYQPIGGPVTADSRIRRVSFRRQ